VAPFVGPGRSDEDFRRPGLAAVRCGALCETTADPGVLDEMIPYLEGPALRPGQNDAFFQPMVSGDYATLFEHCARALDRSLSTGVHGLPLIGTGDWNDGMNKVGEEGKGESVWLGWFLHATLSTSPYWRQPRGHCASRHLVEACSGIAGIT